MRRRPSTHVPRVMHTHLAADYSSAFCNATSCFTNRTDKLHILSLLSRLSGKDWDIEGLGRTVCTLAAPPGVITYKSRVRLITKEAVHNVQIVPGMHASPRVIWRAMQHRQWCLCFCESSPFCGKDEHGFSSCARLPLLPVLFLCACRHVRSAAQPYAGL
jgi:hypothetical protein